MRPNYAQNGVDDRDRCDVVVINEMLDGLNINRNLRAELGDYQVRDQIIKVNTRKRDQNIDLHDININVGRNNIMHKMFAEDQHAHIGVLDNHALVQDGEWVV